MDQPLVTFAHISDTHITTNATPIDAPLGSVEAATQLVERLNQLPFNIDFVLHTGDVIFAGDTNDYETASAIFAQLRHPIHYLAGNSDLPEVLQSKLMGSVEIVTPFHYTFDAKGVQFAIVDSNGGEAEPKPNQFAGSINNDQLEWLRSISTADDKRPLVVATHHNPSLVGYPWLRDVSIQNSDAFHAAILPARDRLRGVFFGHVHQNLDIYRDSVFYCSAPSAWFQLQGNPSVDNMKPDVGHQPGFNIVSIYFNQTVVRRYSFEHLIS